MVLSLTLRCSFVDSLVYGSRILFKQINNGSDVIVKSHVSREVVMLLQVFDLGAFRHVDHLDAITTTEHHGCSALQNGRWILHHTPQTSLPTLQYHLYIKDMHCLGYTVVAL
ncbi:predicted protein [Lichtheimia corymbifera JMRC:FSU:9682]|uniref:Uncharacterized protein n=1 Tax=Lichtheimia corymbifera JMRC:FSU:9682 TaxID=1263082 RepID=A0A068RN60_9FUNG|nr:predicted protein [Lichtheimia corymbifera JMRC:FSU:9682]